MSAGPLIFAMPGNAVAAGALAGMLGWERGELEVHAFPDGESLIRALPAAAGRDAVLVCTLDRPDAKLLPLLLAADTLRDAGARRVGLVAPYLAYLRQDRRFREGEGVTSRYFARLLSGHFDWLLTVDPHLHRHASLAAVYSIPASAVASAPAIADWIRRTVEVPLIIGPDGESSQWAAEVARLAGGPSVVLEKQRRGDRDVAVSVPDVARWMDSTPVLVDDIVSTARTMIATVHRLKAAGLRPPVCVGVHAVFAGDAERELRAAGVQALATTNTISHPSNAIDVMDLLAFELRRLLA